MSLETKTDTTCNIFLRKLHYSIFFCVLNSQNCTCTEGKDIYERKCNLKYPLGLGDTEYARTTGVVPSLIL